MVYIKCWINSTLVLCIGAFTLLYIHSHNLTGLIGYFICVCVCMYIFCYIYVGACASLDLSLYICSVLKILRSQNHRNFIFRLISDHLPEIIWLIDCVCKIYINFTFSVASSVLSFHIQKKKRKKYEHCRWFPIRNIDK